MMAKGFIYEYMKMVANIGDCVTRSMTKKNQAAVKPEELPELLRAIATYESIGDRQTQLALQLLALTFVRTKELIGALWT